jgi:hypothetical protein
MSIKDPLLICGKDQLLVVCFSECSRITSGHDLVSEPGEFRSEADGDVFIKKEFAHVDGDCTSLA